MSNHDDALDGLINDFNALKKEYKHVTSVSYVNNIKADAIEFAAGEILGQSDGELCFDILQANAEELRSDVIG